MMYFRLLIGILYAYMVYLAHGVQSEPGVFPVYFYLLVLGCYMIHQVI